jgi:hypothetical protein
MDLTLIDTEKILYLAETVIWLDNYWPVVSQVQ